MNDITGIVVKDLLQTKLKKYKVYYNSSYQYGDYDMSDYYKSRIKELNIKLSKLVLNDCKEFDKWMESLITRNGTTNY